MKSRIAIIASKDSNRFGMPASAVLQTYSDAVLKAGGLPFIVPVTEELVTVPAMVDGANGFLFIGGMDIDPALYGESPHAALGNVDAALDRFQLAAVNVALARRRPTLAICRGCQIVNVALGGTLFQDIPAQIGPTALKHTQDTLHTGDDHAVELTPGSRLHRLFGPAQRVNSRHHQSIKTPGRGLRITARAPDGVIEGAQHESLPLDLVQWHPELMLRKDDRMLPLFRHLIRSAGDG